LLARSLGALTAAALVAVGIGCTDSNNIVGVSRTPTPPPAANIAGSWTGTYDPNDEFNCEQGLSAQASFTVDGSNVVGTLSATALGPYDCGFQSDRFQGTIQGSAIAGNIAGVNYPAGSTVSGYVSGDAIELSFTNANGFSSSGGRMHLHR